MVRIHAQTIRPATFQRTERRRRREPTPMIAPVIVWVVETGIPKWAAPNSVTAPAASAAKPHIGCKRVMRDPMVWTMRQPPDKVPRPMAAWASKTIQNGMANFPIGSLTRYR